MGVTKGLSVDGLTYFSDTVSGKTKPGWLDFSQQIARLTGSYTLLNMVTGIQGLENFLFRTHNWLIGGVRFDGIMRTEHASRVRATEYPVQTGVTMADHAVVEPAELTIEIMVSDSSAKSYVTHNALLDSVLDAMIAKNKAMDIYTNIMPATSPVLPIGQGRAVNAWEYLKFMQQTRVPIQVVTRLQTYDNMIIEELSAPDDAKTLNALKVTVRLKEIIFVKTAETVVSARPATTEQTNDGQVPVDTGVNSTTAYELGKKIGIIS